MSEKKSDNKETISQAILRQNQLKNQQKKQKLLDYELSKIKKLTINQILTQKRAQPNKNQLRPISPDYLSISRAINQQFNVQEGRIGEKTPGQVWANYIVEGARIRSNNNKQVNRNRILNFIKRGKLGIDLYLIIFAGIGSLLLPYYFFQRFKIQRRRIIEGRGIDPDLIQYLDENSSIDIDEVSLNTVHYKNEVRQELVRKQMQNLQKMEQLEKEINDL